MNSTLLGLPREIKELIYFDALSHAANMILGLPLSPEVKKINPNGVAAMAKDVSFLAEFVDSLDNAMILKENLDELQQTVQLMQTEDPNEYFDNATRNRKFGRVDPLNGPRILEKYILHLSLSFVRGCGWAVTNFEQTDALSPKSHKDRQTRQFLITIWHAVRGQGKMCMEFEINAAWGFCFPLHPSAFSKQLNRGTISPQTPSH
jgi:hypothetical protein